MSQTSILRVGFHSLRLFLGEVDDQEVLNVAIWSPLCLTKTLCGRAADGVFPQTNG